MDGAKTGLAVTGGVLGLIAVGGITKKIHDYLTEQDPANHNHGAMVSFALEDIFVNHKNMADQFGVGVCGDGSKTKAQYTALQLRELSYHIFGNLDSHLELKKAIEKYRKIISEQELIIDQFIKGEGGLLNDVEINVDIQREKENVLSELQNVLFSQLSGKRLNNKSTFRMIAEDLLALAADMRRESGDDFRRSWLRYLFTGSVDSYTPIDLKGKSADVKDLSNSDNSLVEQRHSLSTHIKNTHTFFMSFKSVANRDHYLKSPIHKHTTVDSWFNRRFTNTDLDIITKLSFGNLNNFQEFLFQLVKGDVDKAFDSDKALWASKLRTLDQQNTVEQNLVELKSILSGMAETFDNRGEDIKANFCRNYQGVIEASMKQINADMFTTENKFYEFEKSSDGTLTKSGERKSAPFNKKMSTLTRGDRNILSALNNYKDASIRPTMGDKFLGVNVDKLKSHSENFIEPVDDGVAINGIASMIAMFNRGNNVEVAASEAAEKLGLINKQVETLQASIKDLTAKLDNEKDTIITHEVYYSLCYNLIKKLDGKCNPDIKKICEEVISEELLDRKLTLEEKTLFIDMLDSFATVINSNSAEGLSIKIANIFRFDIKKFREGLQLGGCRPQDINSQVDAKIKEKFHIYIENINKQIKLLTAQSSVLVEQHNILYEQSKLVKDKKNSLVSQIQASIKLLNTNDADSQEASDFKDRMNNVFTDIKEFRGFIKEVIDQQKNANYTDYVQMHFNKVNVQIELNDSLTFWQRCVNFFYNKYQSSVNMKKLISTNNFTDSYDKVNKLHEEFSKVIVENDDVINEAKGVISSVQGIVDESNVVNTTAIAVNDKLSTIFSETHEFMDKDVTKNKIKVSIQKNFQKWTINKNVIYYSQEYMNNYSDSLVMGFIHDYMSDESEDHEEFTKKLASINEFLGTSVSIDVIKQLVELFTKTSVDLDSKNLDQGDIVKWLNGVGSTIVEAHFEEVYKQFELLSQELFLSIDNLCTAEKDVATKKIEDIQKQQKKDQLLAEKKTEIEAQKKELEERIKKLDESILGLSGTNDSKLNTQVDSYTSEKEKLQVNMLSLDDLLQNINTLKLPPLTIAQKFTKQALTEKILKIWNDGTLNEGWWDSIKTGFTESLIDILPAEGVNVRRLTSEDDVSWYHSQFSQERKFLDQVNEYIDQLCNKYEEELKLTINALHPQLVEQNNAIFNDHGDLLKRRELLFKLNEMKKEPNELIVKYDNDKFDKLINNLSLIEKDAEFKDLHDEANEYKVRICTFEKSVKEHGAKSLAFNQLLRQDLSGWDNTRIEELIKTLENDKQANDIEKQILEQSAIKLKNLVYDLNKRIVEVFKTKIGQLAVVGTEYMAKSNELSDVGLETEINEIQRKFKDTYGHQQEQAFRYIAKQVLELKEFIDGDGDCFNQVKDFIEGKTNGSDNSDEADVFAKVFWHKLLIYVSVLAYRDAHKKQIKELMTNNKRQIWRKKIEGLFAKKNMPSDEAYSNKQRARDTLKEWGNGEYFDEIAFNELPEKVQFGKILDCLIDIKLPEYDITVKKRDWSLILKEYYKSCFDEEGFKNLPEDVKFGEILDCLKKPSIVDTLPTVVKLTHPSSYNYMKDQLESRGTYHNTMVGLVNNVYKELNSIYSAYDELINKCDSKKATCEKNKQAYEEQLLTIRKDLDKYSQQVEEMKLVIADGGSEVSLNNEFKSQIDELKTQLEMKQATFKVEHDKATREMNLLIDGKNACDNVIKVVRDYHDIVDNVKTDHAWKKRIIKIADELHDRFNLLSVGVFQNNNPAVELVASKELVNILNTRKTQESIPLHRIGRNTVVNVEIPESDYSYDGKKVGLLDEKFATILGHQERPRYLQIQQASPANRGDEPVKSTYTQKLSSDKKIAVYNFVDVAVKDNSILSVDQRLSMLGEQNNWSVKMDEQLKSYGITKDEVKTFLIDEIEYRLQIFSDLGHFVPATSFKAKGHDSVVAQGVSDVGSAIASAMGYFGMGDLANTVKASAEQASGRIGGKTKRVGEIDNGGDIYQLMSSLRRYIKLGANEVQRQVLDNYDAGGYCGRDQFKEAFVEYKKVMLQVITSLDDESSTNESVTRVRRLAMVAGLSGQEYLLRYKENLKKFIGVIDAYVGLNDSSLQVITETEFKRHMEDSSCGLLDRFKKVGIENLQGYTKETQRFTVILLKQLMLSISQGEDESVCYQSCEGFFNFSFMLVEKLVKSYNGENTEIKDMLDSYEQVRIIIESDTEKVIGERIKDRLSWVIELLGNQFLMNELIINLKDQLDGAVNIYGFKDSIIKLADSFKVLRSSWSSNFNPNPNLFEADGILGNQITNPSVAFDSQAKFRSRFVGTDCLFGLFQLVSTDLIENSECFTSTLHSELFVNEKELKNGVYKTINNKYFQVINGSIAELIPKKPTFDFVGEQRLDVAQFNQLFSNYKIEFKPHMEYVLNTVLKDFGEEEIKKILENLQNQTITPQNTIKEILIRVFDGVLPNGEVVNFVSSFDDIKEVGFFKYTRVINSLILWGVAKDVIVKTDAVQALEELRTNGFKRWHEVFSLSSVKSSPVNERQFNITKLNYFVSSCISNVKLRKDDRNNLESINLGSKINNYLKLFHGVLPKELLDYNEKLLDLEYSRIKEDNKIADFCSQAKKLENFRRLYDVEVKVIPNNQKHKNIVLRELQERAKLYKVGDDQIVPPSKIKQDVKLLRDKNFLIQQISANGGNIPSKLATASNYKKRDTTTTDVDQSKVSAGVVAVPDDSSSPTVAPVINVAGRSSTVDDSVISSSTNPFDDLVDTNPFDDLVNTNPDEGLMFPMEG